MDSKKSRSPDGYKQFEAILFDLGSTLIYFDGEWTEIIPQGDTHLARRLMAAGIKVDETSFSNRFRELLQDYYIERETEFIEYTTAYILRQVLAEYGYPAVPNEIVGNALEAMYAITQSYWKPDPEAHATLETLRRSGYRLGLISNAGDDADVQTLLDQAQLRDYFEIILTSAAVGIRKPNPKIFSTALNHIHTQPSQAAMVGDTLGADILGARNAGIFSIWITRYADTPANRAHADTIHPDATIHSLGDLPGLLQKLTDS